MILSARHGLVYPDQMIPPYDADAAQLKAEQHGRLTFAVAQKLRAIELRRGSVIELHAGAACAALLTDSSYLCHDFAVRLPMRGKQIGEQLSEYLQVTQLTAGERELRKAAARAKRGSPPSIRGAYSGAPIVATKAFVRAMPEFKSCKAECWILFNEHTRTVTFANTYNGVLKATYDPRHYTHPYKPAVHDPKMDRGSALGAARWPRWLVAEPASRMPASGVAPAELVAHLPSRINLSGRTDFGICTS